MALKLVPNWKSLWKSYTVLGAGAGIGLPFLYQYVASLLNALLPQMSLEVQIAVHLVFFVAIIIGRGLDQGLTPEQADAAVDALTKGEE